MRVVYVAGPFRAQTGRDGYNYWEQEQNIRRAEELSLQVWLTGLAVPICPHLNTRFFQGAGPDRLWLEGDLAIVDRCDAMILVGGWGGSTGTLGEIKHATDLGLPIFTTFNRLLAWLDAQDDIEPSSPPTLRSV